MGTVVMLMEIPIGENSVFLPCVSNGSQLETWFQVRVGTEQELLQLVLHYQTLNLTEPGGI